MFAVFQVTYNKSKLLFVLNLFIYYGHNCQLEFQLMGLPVYTTQKQSNSEKCDLIALQLYRYSNMREKTPQMRLPFPPSIETINRD
jgi:hypothetical protein